MPPNAPTYKHYVVTLVMVIFAFNSVWHLWQASKTVPGDIRVTVASGAPAEMTA